MRRLAGDAFAAQGEGAAGGSVGDVDSDDHADAQRDAQDEERALEETPANMTCSETEQSCQKSALITVAAGACSRSQTADSPWLADIFSHGLL